MITVATLPGRGLYARHLGHPEGVDGVHRPTITPTPAPGAAPPAFDRRWLTANMGIVDVVHVHGVPARQRPADVEAAVDVVRAAGRPLVVTAYHLSDPTGEDDERHLAQIGHLVQRADAVITLTQSAATELSQRWGVDPLVVPHPHVVDFVRMRRQRPCVRRGPFVVGTHLGALRTPLDPVALVSSLADAVRRMSGAVLSVQVNENVLDPGSSSYDPRTVSQLQRIAATVGGRLHTRPRLSEPDLWDHIFGVDVCVLPGLHGSHSVWPEACFDLGTQSLVPSGTHAANQRPCLVFDCRDGAADPASLAAALEASQEHGSVWRADPGERWKERVAVSESLRGVYERVCGLDRV